MIARAARFVAACAALVLLPCAEVRAGELRFAVVNLSGRDAPEALVAEVEREIARLRPGTRAIDEPAMRRLLSSGESPTDAAGRLWAAAEHARSGGDCATAVPLATEAEEIALAQIGINEERDLLKRIYVTLIQCEDSLGRPAPLARAARLLRGLVALPPATLPPEIWQRSVENAVPAAEAPRVELQVDSEPANAQVSINFHGEGVTPHTLSVPQGEVLVEVEKEGYKKAFRRLDVGAEPTRTVFRLVERGRDRLELAFSAMGLVASGDPRERPRSLSQIAQWARADFVICLKVGAGRVRLWQFDAERGAFAREVIDSPYDDHGRVEVLATRATPSGGGAVGALAPGGKPIELPVAKPDERAAPGSAGLPSTFEEKQRPRIVFRRTKAPWWGWVIAAAVAGSIAALVIHDQPVRASSLEVDAHYTPVQ